jgi:SAM-dependent methyltransferase
MRVDVNDLRAFYARPLGGAVRRLIGHRIRARWRNVAGLTVVGLGYATPYLGPYRAEAETLSAFMPATQGALVWPSTGETKSVLVNEEALPLLDSSVDRMLVVHCLEGAERVGPLLREVWRVLAPEGRLLLVVPNRRSVWARVETTPLGHGRPYSRGQLERLLVEAMFAPFDWSWALHMPPIERAVVLRSATAFERVGARIWPSIGGVMLVEARKELVAPTGRRARVRVPGGLVIAPSGAAGAVRSHRLTSAAALENEDGLLAEQVLEPD